MNKVSRQLTRWSVAITLLALAAACSSPNPTQNTAQSTATPSQASGNNSATETALKPSELPLSQKTHKIGEIVPINDKNLNIQFTVNGIREHAGTGVIKPNRGNKWIVISTGISNKGQEAQTFSVVSFELVDNQNNHYEVALLATTLEDVKSPSGQLNPGEERQGELPFEVPAKATGLKLLFKPKFSECAALASKPKASATLNCEPIVVKLN
ncbi:MAG TPA: DUF4352 domain-containing protein [Coleofasciculaceae cyanobacterium]